MENIIKHWWGKNKIIIEHFCIFPIEIYKGYFDLCFQFSNLRIQIFYSTCVNSIDNLINWINEIENKKSNIYLNIDEEGKYTRITLERMHKLNENIYELKIINEAEPYYEYEFKKIISINTFLEKLLYAIKMILDENIWGKDNIYRNEIMKNINELFLKYKTNEYNECINCKDKICKK